MEERLNRVKQQLQQSSYKLTPQREATVYRTLELLADLKVVDKVSFGDGVSRFDLRKEGSKHFHHHLVCMECGRVDEIEEDLLPQVEERVENEFNFKILDHRLTFHGICETCQKEGKGVK